MQFNTIGGRVDVKPNDYGLAARFAKRHSFVCMAVMLRQYMSEAPTLAVIGAADTYACPKMFPAKPLNKKVIDALLADLGPVTKVQNALSAWLDTYPWANADALRKGLYVSLRRHVSSASAVKSC